MAPDCPHRDQEGRREEEGADNKHKEHGVEMSSPGREQTPVRAKVMEGAWLTTVRNGVRGISRVQQTEELGVI